MPPLPEQASNLFARDTAQVVGDVEARLNSLIQTLDQYAFQINDLLKRRMVADAPLLTNATHAALAAKAALVLLVICRPSRFNDWLQELSARNAPRGGVVSPPGVDAATLRQLEETAWRHLRICLFYLTSDGIQLAQAIATHSPHQAAVEQRLKKSAEEYSAALHAWEPYRNEMLAQQHGDRIAARTTAANASVLPPPAAVSAAPVALDGPENYALPRMPRTAAEYFASAALQRDGVGLTDAQALGQFVQAALRRAEENKILLQADPAFAANMASAKSQSAVNDGADVVAGSVYNWWQRMEIKNKGKTPLVDWFFVGEEPKRLLADFFAVYSAYKRILTGSV